MSERRIILKIETKIKDGELLDESHFPIQGVFNMVDDERFLKIINCISK